MSGRDWIRKSTLVVANKLSQIDLSNLHYKFTIKSADKETPHSAYIRVYNLKKETANQIIDPKAEFTKVTLQAGYQETGMAMVFDGNIIQVRKGRETSIDSFVDIVAADGDIILNTEIVTGTLAAGSTPKQRLNFAKGDAKVAYQPDNIEGATLPRARVFHGMKADELHTISRSSKLTFSVQKEKLIFVPLDGYIPGDPIVVNAQTGMIGWPERTNLGIKVRVLINPDFKVNGLIKIDNRSILQPLAPASMQSSNQAAADEFRQYFGEPGGDQSNAYVPTDDDGTYCIKVLEYSGDTRGQEWYADIICVSIDQTSESPAFTEKYYGAGGSG